LKRAFTTAPILAHFDEDKEILLETDASSGAIGAVLSQEGADGKMHPVAFMSKSLTSAERNYDVHDRELLAIVYSCTVWRQYLDSGRLIRILTDHKNLEYFRTEKMLTRRQARWSQRLNQLNYTLEYKPGTENGKADALSRREELMKDSKALETEILLRPQNIGSPMQLAALTIEKGEGALRRSGATDQCQGVLRICATLQLPEDEIQRLLLAELKEDAFVKDAYAELIAGAERVSPAPEGKAEEWTVDSDGFLLYRGWMYVPNKEVLRSKVLALCHDQKLVGHYGRDKTTEMVLREFWWPRLRETVAEYVATCDVCQRNRRPRAKPMGELHPLPVPEGKWKSVTMDHITGLPVSKGFDPILVIVDRFTKRAHFVPCRKDDDTHALASIFVNEWVRLHGYPKDLLTD
jgi:hypothetical protein